MAIELEELFESREVTVSSNGFSETRTYHVKGEADPDEVALQLKPDIGTAHPVFPYTILTGIKITPEEADDLLKVEYSYEDQSSSGGGDNSRGRNSNNETWVFDMVSQSKTIDSVQYNQDPAPDVGSYQTMYYIDNNGNPQAGRPSDTALIGYNDGSPVGIDVYRPSGSLRVNKLFNIAEITSQFRTDIYNMENTVNKAAWVDWDVEEVLFIGASISYDYVAQTASVDYNFLFGKTKTRKFDVMQEGAVAAAQLGKVSIIQKPFDHIWLRMPNSDMLEKVANNPAEGFEFKYFPLKVYLTKVYEVSDFDVLGLVGPE